MPDRYTLTEEQKSKIKINIAQLDYLEGTGIISNNRKRLAKEMFIFISAGGTGRKALARLKQTMVNAVEPDDMKRVMFLAVDTALKELEECVTSGIFEKKEILKVPYKGAHDSIAPDKILPQLAAWVHKELWAETGGESATSKEFNGTGAGGKRQCGRVLFCQSAAQNKLSSRLKLIPDAASELDEVDRIQIFFLSGIAGGTGSGMILDLAFLSRHFLKNILGATYHKVTFSAYLFLPSASGDGAAASPEEEWNGNCNAYAALKEIDHYMTLTERQEHFQMDYGTIGASNVDIAENVFDFCTLVEGVGDEGAFFTENGETSRQIAADSILNIICAESMDKGADGKERFLVDSFLSNMGEKTKGKIEQHADRLWPRDANYIYSVIGYSSCVVPLDLLTVYVAKKIFDEAFRKFLRAEDASEEAAVVFLAACGLEFKEMNRSYRTLTPKRLIKDIQAQADADFKEYGPFYMVNLIGGAADLLENAPRDYLHKARAKMSGLNAGKWAVIVNLYEEAAVYLREINKSLYEVYSYALQVLRDVLETNARLITETKEYQRQFGKSFCWSPIDLTPGNQATEAVAQYLDGMLDPEDITRKAAVFMEEICRKKEEWTGIGRDSRHGVQSLNIAGEIREFIASNLQECINTTLEEFLVKAYSGKKDASVFTWDPASGRQVCSKDTKDAATHLLNLLSRRASALASPQNRFALSETYSNVYLMLPDNCPWLFEAVLDQGETYGIRQENIYKSSARDAVTLCRLYAGVPAWALFWTAGAEACYEGNDGQGPLRTGLHMDQGESGTNWADLPNLYPERLWSQAERARRSREAAISGQVRRDMERAAGMGLLLKDAADPQYYRAWLLKGHPALEELTRDIELKGNKRYAQKEALCYALGSGHFESVRVCFVNMVMTTPDAMEPEKLEEFRFGLACRIMRRKWNEYRRLQETLNMAGELEEFVRQHNERAIEDASLTLFINCLKWELLVYDSRKTVWKGMLENESMVGRRLEDRFSQICAHFHGFYAFSGLGPEKQDEYRERLEALLEEATDAQYEQAQCNFIKMKNSLILMKEAKKASVKPWPDESPFCSANESPWPMASLDFEEKAGGEEAAALIRNFYAELIKNM